ncbi:MAG: hypothetical protein KatS3mg030_029 [Saprospiraceae bacterium]|nr:MAG: hypothetical protein KatS3mg030_029 [Saprospiraceae bacterium]
MKHVFSLSIIMITSLGACGQKQPSANQAASKGENQQITSQVDTLGYIDLDVEAFREKMKEPGVVILDVRTPEETAQGKIEGAIELDYFDEHFADKLDSLDRNKTYLVYCRSGNRSAKASALMVQKGFRNVYNLKGGYRAWTSSSGQ